MQCLDITVLHRGSQLSDKSVQKLVNEVERLAQILVLEESFLKELGDLREQKIRIERGGADASSLSESDPEDGSDDFSNRKTRKNSSVKKMVARRMSSMISGKDREKVYEVSKSILKESRDVEADCDSILQQDEPEEQLDEPIELPVDEPKTLVSLYKKRRSSLRTTKTLVPSNRKDSMAQSVSNWNQRNTNASRNPSAIHSRNSNVHSVYDQNAHNRWSTANNYYSDHTKVSSKMKQKVGKNLTHNPKVNYGIYGSSRVYDPEGQEEMSLEDRLTRTEGVAGDLEEMTRRLSCFADGMDDEIDGMVSD